MGKASDRACVPSCTLIVIMVHDLSLTLNVQKIRKLPEMIITYFFSLFLSSSVFHMFMLVTVIIPCICQVFIVAVSVYSATLMAAITVNG